MGSFIFSAWSYVSVLKRSNRSDHSTAMTKSYWQHCSRSAGGSQSLWAEIISISDLLLLQTLLRLLVKPTQHSIWTFCCWQVLFKTISQQFYACAEIRVFVFLLLFHESVSPCFLQLYRSLGISILIKSPLSPSFLLSLSLSPPCLSQSNRQQVMQVVARPQPQSACTSRTCRWDLLESLRNQEDTGRRLKWAVRPPQCPERRAITSPFVAIIGTVGSVIPNPAGTPVKSRGRQGSLSSLTFMAQGQHHYVDSFLLYSLLFSFIALLCLVCPMHVPLNVLYFVFIIRLVCHLNTIRFLFSLYVILFVSSLNLIRYHYHHNHHHNHHYHERLFVVGECLLM